MDGLQKVDLYYSRTKRGTIHETRYFSLFDWPASDNKTALFGDDLLAARLTSPINNLVIFPFLSRIPHPTPLSIEMATKTPPVVTKIQSNPPNPYASMNLHAQDINCDELNEMASFHPSDPTTQIDSSDPSILPLLDADFDLDDIRPEESFSTHVSPAESLVNGVAYKKPAISLFTQETVSIESESGFPSPPVSPVVTREKDDIPGRYSDVEDTPPLRAAGFVGKEIPTLDSEGEWEQL